MNPSAYRSAAVAVLLTAASLLGACASPARSVQMTAPLASVTPLTPGSAAYQTVRVVKVQGGSATNPLLESEVSNDQFQAALEATLKEANYLAPDPARATVELTASLEELAKPLLGLNYSVTSKVRYSARSTTQQKPIFDQEVAATGEATLGQALVGVERIRLADEAAIRENIIAFLRRFHDAMETRQTASAATDKR